MPDTAKVLGHSIAVISADMVSLFMGLLPTDRNSDKHLLLGFELFCFKK